MNSYPRKFLSFLLSICMLLSLTCFQDVEICPISALSSIEQIESFVMPQNDPSDDAAAGESSGIFLQKTNRLHRSASTGMRKSASRSSGCPVSFDPAALFSRNTSICSREDQVYPLSSKELLTRYIHNSDGKK